jgi:hypothetical protein
MAVESPGCRTAAYRRRRPEQTALYQVIQQHLETYLALAGEEKSGTYHHSSLGLIAFRSSTEPREKRL